MQGKKQILVVAIPVIAITLVCIFFSSSAWAQFEQEKYNMIQVSNFWLTGHNAIEKVINDAYYSLVDGDGDKFLSYFTPDVIWYKAYETDPWLYNVWMDKKLLKTDIADKAKEVKKDYATRICLVRHVNIAPENVEKWVTKGDAGNGYGIATAVVWEYVKDLNKKGETILHSYEFTYMVKVVNGKWMITSVIRKEVNAK